MSKTAPTTQPGAKKRKGSGVLRRLRARTQSETIHLTQEDEWDTEVPNIRLSRVFAVVLVLHVVAVGGMLAFQMLNPDDEATAAEVAALPAAASAATAASPAASDTLPQQPRIGDPAVDGLRHYRVQSGDDLLTIARRFNVSPEELESLNGLDSGNKLFTGAILYLPNRQIKAAPADDVTALLASREARIIEPNNNPDSPGARLAAAPEAPRPAPVGAMRQVSQSPGEQVAPPGPAQAVQVPRAEPVSTARAAAPAATREVVGAVQVYTIEKGDTAYAIGRKFGIPPETLLKVNGVADASRLQIGQKLKIPVVN